MDWDCGCGHPMHELAAPDHWQCSKCGFRFEQLNLLDNIHENTPKTNAKRERDLDVKSEDKRRMFVLQRTN